MSELFTIEHTIENGVLVISFMEDDQLRDPDPLKDFIQKHVKEGNTKILLDLENVTYISSSMLGLFISISRDLSSNTGKIKILNPQPGISNVFRMTRLDRIFEMFNDRDTALKSF